MELLFWAHTSKSNPELVTIYFRLTLSKTRVELGSTGIKVHRKHWSSEAQRITARTPVAQQQNHTLEIWRSRGMAIHNELMLKREPFSASYFKKLFQQNGRGFTFLQLFTTYLAGVKKDPDITAGTYETYSAVFKKVDGWLVAKKQADLPAEKFSLAVIEQYRGFMRITEKRASATIRKHTQTIKQVLSWGLLNDYTVKDPLQGYRVAREKTKPPVFLLPFELMQLLEFSFAPHETVLSQIRDNFLIQCFTGFAYADLKTFTSSDILSKEQRAPDGSTIKFLPWVEKDRKKTGNTAMQPLHPIVSQILAARYDGRPEKLRIRPNQKTNLYLKVIGLKLDFIKVLTTHVGRRTFANLCLNGGLFSPLFASIAPEVLEFKDGHFSKEATITMMGRTSDKGLEAYVKVDERRIMSELQ
ncbi:phage integrase SAM-like domain-containing protein [Spirosoma spitsbergense]|uniref:phage integrase SAM-like domain-containing protein n=1 Tax=Spirosoma spitsbergense TaxID=431554 RepID=UPI001469B573|nr:phage integrase SAM-like domain-containing protein [Spirosoma spitsbergense]